MTSRLLEPNDYATTVVAVPPIALGEDGRVSQTNNEILIKHMCDGGVRIVLYGGNANLYHYDLDLFTQAVETMTLAQEKGLDVIGSIGPDFGKATDQAPLVARAGISNIMLLPMAFPADSEGIAAGVRRIADRLGHGVVFYIRRANYIAPATLARLVDEGAVRMVKYAVEQDEPATDPYLDELIQSIELDRIASGMGETPVLDHIATRKLATFTSGAICLAPRAALALLPRLKAGQMDALRDEIGPFLDFERVRKRYGGIQVLHEAVSMQICNMGRPLPMLSALTAEGQSALSGPLADLAALEAAAR